MLRRTRSGAEIPDAITTRFAGDIETQRKAGMPDSYPQVMVISQITESVSFEGLLVFDVILEEFGAIVLNRDSWDYGITWIAYCRTADAGSLRG